MHDFQWAYLRQDGQRGIGNRELQRSCQPMTAQAVGADRTRRLGRTGLLRRSLFGSRLL